MKKIILLFLFPLIFHFASAQISSILPQTISIAQTSVADSHNWAIFNNPAMLGYIKNTELDIQFENRFLLLELSTKSVQLGFSSEILNTGLSFSYFGYSLYHEMLVGLSFARNFSDKFSMGLQFVYYTSYFTASNSYHGVLLPQFGLSTRLTPKLSLGFNTFNPFQSNIQTEYTIKRLPSIFSLGTEYYFSSDLVWRTEIDKEVSSNYRFATGFEYQMLQNLNIKLGAYGSDYLIPSLGIGFNVGAFLVDLNCDLHPLLGLNTLASIKYKFYYK